MIRPSAMFIAVIVVAGACGSEDDRPVSWSYIHAAIIKPNCATASCHAGFAPPNGVRLDERDLARQRFLEIPVGIALLRGQMGGLRRMPPDQPLPDADLDLIEKWIDLGFPDN